MTVSKTQCLYSIPELGGGVESNMEQPQSKSPATEKRAMIESNVKLMDPESLPSGLRACAAIESHVQTQLQCLKVLKKSLQFFYKCCYSK